jgi:ribose transport system substrate-binding protein
MRTNNHHEFGVSKITHRAALISCGGMLALSLAACGAVSGGATTAASGGGTTAASSGSTSLRHVKTITYVNPLPSYADFNTIGQCAKDEAAKLGYTLHEVGTTGTAVDNQTSVAEINQAVANGTDALIVVPLSADVYTSAIKAARAKGIYVVAAGTGAPSTGQQSEAGTSGTQLGKLVADEVGAKNPHAVVGFLSEGPDQAVQVQAIDGFESEARSKFPNMKVATSQFDAGDVTKDQPIVSNMLTACPSINALYIINGASLAPAAAAVRQAGMTGKVAIIGNDITPVSRGLISNGSMYGVADQGWCAMGTDSVDAIKALAAGKKVPAFVATPLSFTTKTNLPPQ